MGGLVIKRRAIVSQPAKIIQIYPFWDLSDVTISGHMNLWMYTHYLVSLNIVSK